MSFDKEIQVYIKGIKLSLNGFGNLSSNKVRDIAKIYKKHFGDRLIYEHRGKKINKPINTSCNTCIKELLNDIINRKLDQGVKYTFPKQENFDDMSWNDLRKYCKGLGIKNIPSKKRYELIEELRRM